MYTRIQYTSFSFSTPETLAEDIYANAKHHPSEFRRVFIHHSLWNGFKKQLGPYILAFAVGSVLCLGIAGLSQWLNWSDSVTDLFSALTSLLIVSTLLTTGSFIIYIFQCYGYWRRVIATANASESYSAFLIAASKRELIPTQITSPQLASLSARKHGFGNITIEMIIITPFSETKYGIAIVNPMTTDKKPRPVSEADFQTHFSNNSCAGLSVYEGKAGGGIAFLSSDGKPFVILRGKGVTVSLDHNNPARQQQARQPGQSPEQTESSTTVFTVSRNVIVSNTRGLCARPAVLISDVASQFNSKITISRTEDRSTQANGKSVMELIILSAPKGTALRICAEGVDAQAAVDRIAQLFIDNFGEK